MNPADQYEEYRGKQRYYGNIHAKLSEAYRKIDRIKSASDHEESRTDRVTRGLSWKGHTRDSFERTVVSLVSALDAHGDKLDRIQDNINREKNAAWQQEHDYGLLIEGLGYIVTEVGNVFN